MSILPRETIKICAESLGVDDLGNDVASALASDTEYRVREIIQEAMKFMKNSKRERLSTTDINAALRLRHVEQLYGYTGTDTVRFQRALNAKNLFFVHDDTVALADIVTQPLPALPRHVALTAHWLAVEGVQPAIPQNPLPIEPDAAGSSDVTQSDAANASALAAAAEPAVDVRPMVKHTLSEELQAYFQSVTSSVLAFREPPGADAKARLAWTRQVGALRNDGGIQQLVPYLTQFVGDQVQRQLRQLPVLRALVALCDAILANTNINVEPYLHQLMPPLLTCIVGKRLSASTSDDHWSLRDAAATTVAAICDRYGRLYPTLQARVTKTLLVAFLDSSKPLTTHYGAIRGLAALGPHVVSLLVLPNTAAFVDGLRVHLDASPPTESTGEAQRCFDALRDAACRFVQAESQLKTTLVAPVLKNDNAMDQDESSGAPTLTVSYQDLVDIFGDALVARDPVGLANEITI